MHALTDARHALIAAGVRTKPAVERRGSPEHAAVAQLQRDAGNAAVAEMLAVQRDDLREPRKAEETGAKIADSPARAKRIPGQPPKLKDADEESYRKSGESRLSDLGGAATSSATGHTAPGPIEGFPDWFVQLQDALIGSQLWRNDKEEVAQKVLADYALKRFALEHDGDATKVPPTVRIFIEHIGRSTSNVDAARAAGLPSSADLGGGGINAANWCAAAGSSSVQLALKAAGLMVDTAKLTDEQWLLHPPSVPSVGLPQITVDSKIEPGDQVSYAESILQAGGHTVTALTDSSGEGTRFEHASGNAGGGKSGSVRLGQSPARSKIPPSITWDDIANKSGAANKVPAGTIWVYIIVKYSKFWADLGAIDVAKPNVWQSPAGQAFLSTYKLKPRPTK